MWKSFIFSTLAVSCVMTEGECVFSSFICQIFVEIYILAMYPVTTTVSFVEGKSTEPNEVFSSTWSEFFDEQDESPQNLKKRVKF